MKNNSINNLKHTFILLLLYRFIDTQKYIYFPKILKQYLKDLVLRKTVRLMMIM